MGSKKNSEQIFLGVVDRRGAIYIPWRGTHVNSEHNYESGQNVLVTLDISTAGCAKVVKIDLPTIQQVKDMKDELLSDWRRFTETFKSSDMRLKVRMLHALDNVMRLEN